MEEKSVWRNAIIDIDIYISIEYSMPCIVIKSGNVSSKSANLNKQQQISVLVLKKYWFVIHIKHLQILQLLGDIYYLRIIFCIAKNLYSTDMFAVLATKLQPFIMKVWSGILWVNLPW